MAEQQSSLQSSPDADPSVEQALDDAQARLNQVEQAVQEGGAESGTESAAGAEAATETAAPDPAPVFEPAAVGDLPGALALANSIDLLGDVDLQVTIELGRTEMLVEDVLRLNSGSVVELDKLAGDPVDVYVNQRLVARGEVLVLNDNFCIRISEIVADLKELQMEVAE